MFLVFTGTVSQQSFGFFFMCLTSVKCSRDAITPAQSDGDGGGGGATDHDSENHAIIKLNNGMVLYFREVNKYVVCSTIISQSIY